MEGSCLLRERRAFATKIALSRSSPHSWSCAHSSLLPPPAPPCLRGEGKYHLFTGSLLPSFCSCFTESITKTELSKLSPAERGQECYKILFIFVFNQGFQILRQGHFLYQTAAYLPLPFVLKERFTGKLVCLVITRIKACHSCDGLYLQTYLGIELASDRMLKSASRLYAGES